MKNRLSSLSRNVYRNGYNKHYDRGAPCIYVYDGDCRRPDRPTAAMRRRRRWLYDITGHVVGPGAYMVTLNSGAQLSMPVIAWGREIARGPHKIRSTVFFASFCIGSYHILAILLVGRATIIYLVYVFSSRTIRFQIGRIIAHIISGIILDDIIGMNAVVAAAGCIPWFQITDEYLAS